MWLALGATCSIVAGVAIATTRSESPHVMPAMPPVEDDCGGPPLPSETTEQVEPIGIVVVASKTQIKTGEALPLAFYVVNRSARPLEVLRSLDASDVGWRYPKIDVEIRDAKGRLVEDPAMGRCGMVNPLTADDFVELASGARFELFGENSFGHYKLRHTDQLASGRYTVTLHYDLRFEAAQKGGPVDAALQARVDKLPKGVYSSPPITIDVK